MRPPSNLAATIALAVLIAVPAASPPARAQTAAEVKELLTTLAPRHRREEPSVIVIRRPVEIVVDDGTVTVDYGYTADVEVQFEYDSARLTRDARRSLAALGRALESGELADFEYLIAGHTDARGSAAYNRALSYDRARAVRDFLIESFAIDPHRLHVIGWGESRLKTPRHPNAAVNRRVEVTLVLPRDVRPQRDRNPAPDTGGIRIEPRTGAPAQDAASADAETGGDLPPCPSGRLGDPRDPTADLDDFGPRPGIDCMPPEGSKVSITPEGKVIIDW